MNLALLFAQQLDRIRGGGWKPPGKAPVTLDRIIGHHIYQGDLGADRSETALRASLRFSRGDLKTAALMPQGSTRETFDEEDD